MIYPSQPVIHTPSLSNPTPALFSLNAILPGPFNKPYIQVGISPPQRSQAGTRFFLVAPVFDCHPGRPPLPPRPLIISIYSPLRRRLRSLC